MLLAQLLDALPAFSVVGPSDVEVRAIQTDSRKVGPGDGFIAYPGVAVDSHAFVPAAVEQGASVVVVERHVEVPPGATRVVVPSGRAAWALMSAAWNGFPSRRFPVVGVTGTDGKTTTSSLIGAILARAGQRVGLVTSVAANIGGVALDTGFHTTTPEPPEIQAHLAEMARQGTDVAIIETTSHALALDKVLGIAYDVAVVTNVTHEHLDFHGTWDNYLAAKARLLEGLSASPRKPGVAKTAVLNQDDASYERLAAIPVERRITYGLAAGAGVYPSEVEMDARGIRLVAHHPGGDIPVSTRLLGAFNMSNALAAVAAALALDVAPESIAAGLAEFSGIPGRLETIDQGQPFGVVVDFAHTPNSLRRVLELGRSIAKGQVAVVFGCAGRRDVAKRPLMGQAAGELADRVYLTAEDPRTEDLAEILAQIAAGVRARGKEPRVVPDRGEAIERALSEARAGDLVLITGKGHEQSMCFGTEEWPWDDREAARAALARLGYAKSD